MHNINQETEQYQKEDDINMVNIKSIHFNSKHSVIKANLKTSSNQAIIVKLYKVHTGSNRNIIPLHICNKYSLGPKRTPKTRNENIKLKTYVSTAITQLSRC